MRGCMHVYIYLIAIPELALELHVHVMLIICKLESVMCSLAVIFIVEH